MHPLVLSNDPSFNRIVRIVHVDTLCFSDAAVSAGVQKNYHSKLHACDQVIKRECKKKLYISPSVVINVFISSLLNHGFISTKSHFSPLHYRPLATCNNKKRFTY